MSVSRPPSSPHRAILFGGILAAIALSVYATMLAGPMRRQARELAQQLRGARAELALLETALAHEPVLRAQHDRLAETLAAMRERIPTDDEVPLVIKQLSQLAGGSRVKIQTIFPQPVSSAPAAGRDTASAKQALYRTMRIQIDALAGYHQVGAFLNAVESGKLPLRLLSLRVSPDTRDLRRHRVQVVLEAPVMAAPAKPQAAMGRFASASRP